MFPVLVTLPTPWGGLPIYSYGVMLGTSLLLAWVVLKKLAGQREGMPEELMSNLFMATAISAIVGARLFYIFANLDEFSSPAKWMAIRSGGLVAYGGFIGGYVGSLVYLKMKKLPLLPWADAVAPTLALGLCCTRIGCYLYGCDFGERLSPDAPEWLKALGTFPHWALGTGDGAGLVCAEASSGSPAWVRHVHAYGLSESAHASYPVHPTQIYESTIGLLLFGLTLLVWKVRRFRGQVILVLVAAYGVWRFFIEFLRDDPERGGALGLSQAQWISLALVPLSVGWYVYFLKRAKDRGEDLTVPAYAGAVMASRDEGPKGDGPKRAASQKKARKKR